MDERTDEQQAADAALTDAIRATIEAYGLQNADGDAEMIVDYLLLVKSKGWFEDGREYNATQILTKDDMEDHVTMLGLIDFAQARTRAYAAS